MSQMPYRASYQLAHQNIVQSLYLHKSVRSAAGLAWLKDILHQLAHSAIEAFSLRLVCKPEEVKIGLYLNASDEQQAELDRFHFSSLVCNRALADFSVNSKAAFDAFHEMACGDEVLRLENLHSLANDVTIPTQLHLFELLNLLFNPDFPGLSDLTIQFNLLAVTAPTEVERTARKLMVKLDFESNIPANTKTHIKNNLAQSLNAGYELDTLLNFSAGKQEQLQQIIDDFQYQALKPFGIKTVPVQADELAEDLFYSALPLSMLDETDSLTRIARLFDLRAALKALTLVSVPASTLKARVDQTGAFDVFISYSSKNFNQALAVCHGLESEGIRCWMAPRDIGPGESYAAAIVKGIVACKAFVLVFSDASNASQHVLREVERAVNANKLIVPFKIEPTELEADLAYFISICHWLDAVTPPLSSHIANLVATLKKQLS
ncbi:hypothetical protein GCM10009410_03570 [Shewanella ulleungensis]|jgi:hypothetical protein|uniref:TIR domain-containing protein n=1 Tax=Shewanella ulleungensis TaxID=2282699 RepID=A0ABQ2QEK3_9GAMM|nr:hypothetical protein GCM10009410_03570 [Shewanella ulleungensis]